MFRSKGILAFLYVVGGLCIAGCSEAARQHPTTAFQHPAASVPVVGTGLELPKGAPVPVVVTIGGEEEARKLGLTPEFVQAQVELRLRRNGITPVRETGRGYFLGVEVGVVGPAWSVNVDFFRVVSYTVEGRTFSRVSATHSVRRYGTHGSDRTFIMDSVLENGIDVLSNEILKAAL